MSLPNKAVTRCIELCALVQETAAIVSEARSEPFVGEARANIILAYRHLQDSAMRLGKAIQALEGGVSVYDAATEVRK